MASTGDIATATGNFLPVSLLGLVAEDPVPFPLYLQTAPETWVLYKPHGTLLDESHIGRLVAEGVQELAIRECDRAAYFERVERSLDAVLHDPSVPLVRRVEVLWGVGERMVMALLESVPTAGVVHRARRTMMAASRMMLREPQGFAAIRRVLSARPDVARHSLTVSFLSMGLARVALGADASRLVNAGLAGLLHDIGRVGNEHLENDPEHTVRGAQLLQSLELPDEVVEAARSHHERFDGSGYPDGRRGAAIPEMARVVGLIDTFDKVYAGQQPRVGVFDALRILAQAYRGCFDERLAQALVRMFR
jgi:putative nucleotidyltransferase with HDIG domain